MMKSNFKAEAATNVDSMHMKQKFNKGKARQQKMQARTQGKNISHSQIMTHSADDENIISQQSTVPSQRIYVRKMDIMQMCAGLGLQVKSTSPVRVSSEATDAPWLIKLKVNGCDATFKRDTDTDLTVLSDEVLKNGQFQNLEKFQKVLHGPFKNPIPLIRKFTATHRTDKYMQFQVLSQHYWDVQLFKHQAQQPEQIPYP